MGVSSARGSLLAAGALFALGAFACASPTPTAAPAPTPTTAFTPEPTVAPTPTLTPIPTPTSIPTPTPMPTFTPIPTPTPTPTFTPTLTPTPTFTPIPTPTSTPTLTPTPTFTPILAPAQWPTPWPPYEGTSVPDGEPTACFTHPFAPLLPPHPEHFIHWVTTGTGDYLVFDYQEHIRSYAFSDSIGKLSLDTGVVEPLINASPYRWRLALYADPSPSESLIAYTSCEFVTNYTSNDDTEIALINWKTLDRKSLTDSAAYDFFPVWSPDGKHIAFLSWLDFQRTYSWHLSSENVAINVVNSEGELAASGRSALLRPVAWSPNSEEFAFIDTINIGDAARRRGPIVQIGVFLTGIDKIEPRQIASATSYESPHFTRLNSITFGGPSWSPDGRYVAFGSSDYDGASVHIVSRDGTNDRVIWQGDSPRPISQVTWSPDGEEILFIADAARVVRPDGSGLRQLELPYEANLPDWTLRSLRAAWSPDSSRIAFYNRQDGIVTVDRDGTGVRIYETP